MSDLHGILPQWEDSIFNDVELLLICGDIIPLNIQFNMPESYKWLKEDFTSWINSLGVKQTVFIAGNHDAYMEQHHKDMKVLFSNNIKYLKNESFDYISDDGRVYKIFGTPYCKLFGTWPFMRENDILYNKYSEIPENLDILISHDAPRIKDLGCIKQEGFLWYGTEAGNELLANAILEKKPSYCFCGHIHSGEHNLQEINGIKMANTSLVNENYNLVYKPLILTIYE